MGVSSWFSRLRVGSVTVSCEMSQVRARFYPLFFTSRLPSPRTVPVRFLILSTSSPHRLNSHGYGHWTWTAYGKRLPNYIKESYFVIAKPLSIRKLVTVISYNYVYLLRDLIVITRFKCLKINYIGQLTLSYNCIPLENSYVTKVKSKFCVCAQIF